MLQSAPRINSDGHDKLIQAYWENSFKKIIDSTKDCPGATSAPIDSEWEFSPPSSFPRSRSAQGVITATYWCYKEGGEKQGVLLEENNQRRVATVWPNTKQMSVPTPKWISFHNTCCFIPLIPMWNLMWSSGICSLMFCAGWDAYQLTMIVKSPYISYSWQLKPI